MQYKTKLKKLDTTFRYLSEGCCTILVTFGTCFIPNSLSLLLAFYAADVILNNLLHEKFYTRFNPYFDQRAIATMYRGARNIAQLWTASFGIRAFAYALSSASFFGVITAVMTVGLLKAAIEILYNSAENSMQATQRSCRDCGNHGWTHV